MKPFKWLIMTGPVLVFLFSACGKGGKPKNMLESEASPSQNQPQEANNIILQIQDRTFTNEDFTEYLSNYYSSSDVNNNQRFQSRLFDSFVENKLVLYMADRENVTVDQQEISEYSRDHQVPADKTNQNHVIENLKRQKYIYFKVYSEISVSEEEIRAYYNDNIEQFKKREEIRLHQILLKDKEKADQIRGILLNSPQRFEEIARTESVSVDAANGGLMGHFEKGMLPREMEDVVFSLRLNTISPVTRSDHGYHIFKVTQKRNRRTLYLSNVQDQIRQKLLSDKLNNAYQTYLQSLKNQLDVKIFHQNLVFDYQTH